MRKEVAEGERLPWGHGAAYPLVTRAAWVTYPVPLNLLVRWIRSFYFSLARSARTSIEQQAYNRGYEAGIRVGRKQGKDEAIEFIREIVKGVKLP
jgi:hypothetical protein